MHKKRNGFLLIFALQNQPDYPGAKKLAGRQWINSISQWLWLLLDGTVLIVSYSVVTLKSEL